jgi:hypothetical protein
VTCDGESIALSGEHLFADPAGAHVKVENEADQSLYLNFAPGRLGPWGGIVVPQGITDLSIQLPPGTAAVMCSDGHGGVTDQVPVEVVDQDGVFIPYFLQCGGESTSLTPSAAASSARDPNLPDPVSTIRAAAVGLTSSDVLELGGYPEAPNPVVRVVHGGDVVAAFDLSMTGNGWVASFDSCPGAGISLPPEPTPYPRGVFEWCPAQPFPEPGRDWAEQASAAALRFIQAYAAGDEAAVTELLDSSVPTDARFPIELVQGAEPTVIDTNAAGGSLVVFGCGNDVAAYTVAITVDDGTDSASLDFTVYLLLREDGWRVWSVY